MCNRGEEPIVDASIALVLPKDNELYVADRLPKLLNNEIFVDRPPAELASYPTVSLHKKSIHVAEKIGDVPIDQPIGREMACNCAFNGMDDGVVKLSLDSAHTHLLNKTRVDQLEKALCDYYQRPVSVKVARTEKLEDETPARKLAREQAERQQQAVDSIEADENIKTIQDVFGGTVNYDSIRPRGQ